MLLFVHWRREIGCKKTIARIRNPEYTKQVEFIKLELGIDHIINPDLATSNEIARYLLKSYNFYSEDFAKGKVAIVDFSINHIPELIGKNNGTKYFRKFAYYIYI